MYFGRTDKGRYPHRRAGGYRPQEGPGDRRLTRGHVKRILTKSSTHPHGIKVMLEEGDQVGRVRNIVKE